MLLIEADGLVTRCDLMGNESPLGKLELPLDDTPVYLLGPIKRITEKPFAEPIIADSTEEYGKTQGANNWFYGYLEDGTVDFHELRQIETPWGVNWGTDKVKFLSLSRSGDHPGLLNKKPVWVVRRWQSPTAGTVRLVGQISVNEAKSTGIDYVLLVDGKQADKKTILPTRDKQPTHIEQTIEVRPNSLVDFCVTPGPNNDLSYDAFSFEIRIFAKRVN